MIKYVIEKPITTMMIFIAIVLVGIISVTSIPKDLFPDMSLPYAIVYVSYNGAGPEEVENLVTKPLESAISTVSDLKSMTSSSSNGTSMVIVEFNDNIDMNFAALNVREKVDMVKGYLPADATDPVIMKLDPSQMPMMMMSISSKNYDLVKLNAFIEDNISNKFERVNGVAQVSLAGAKEKEILVTVIPEKMKAFGLTTTTISNLLASENLNFPGGTLLEGDKNITVRTVGEFKTVNDVKNFPIITQFGTVYLGDIAEVTETYKDISSYSFINGEPSISVIIQKQSVANTVEISKKINKVIDEIKEEYGNLIDVSITYDSADYINSALSSVISSAVIGGLLAIIILYLFLRNIGSTAVIAVSIPTSVLTTFMLMWLCDMSLNIITLGALTIAIGMLVDASIVVLENIDIHKKAGEDAKTASYFGTKEVVTAVFASILTSIVVFLPFVFTSGMVMQMLHSLAWVVIFALCSSLFVSLTLVPMLSSKLGDEANRQVKSKTLKKATSAIKKGLERLEALYEKILTYAVKHKKKIVKIALTFSLISLLCLLFVDVELMPESDEGLYTVSMALPKGTNVDKTLELALDVADQISELKNVKNVYLTVGSGGMMSSMSGGGSSSNIASISVDIGPSNERRQSINEAVDEARILVSNIPGAEFEVASQSSSSISTSSTPVDLQITGEDLETLDEIANELVTMFNQIDGLYEVSSSNDKGEKEANLIIDRLRLSYHNLTTSQVAYGIQTALMGKAATTIKMNGTEIDVTIKMDDTNVQFIKDLNNIYVDSPKGYSVSIAELGDIQIKDSPESITRNDQKRTIDITAKLSGISLGDAQSKIEETLKNYIMPEGYSYAWAGTLEMMIDSFKSLGLAIVMAIIFVYMVMASQFESLLNPFIIMFTVPLAFAGSLYGLFLTGNSLNVTSMMGLIVLVGIVVNNGIILIDFINQARKKGIEINEAVITSGKVRLRPILMTTLTTILGMVPMSLGLGEGGEMLKGMAVSIIFGLLASTLLTLVLIPVLYIIFDEFKTKRKQKRIAKKTVKNN